MRFAKMHGLGNDFIMIQGEWDDPRYGALAVPLCDRFTGIGADGIIVYGPVSYTHLSTWVRGMETPLS